MKEEHSKMYVSFQNVIYFPTWEKSRENYVETA